MEKSKKQVEIGIYLVSLLMMGVVGVASCMATIAAKFSDVSMTTIQVGLISVPCIVIMVVTLLCGKLMDVMSKKTLAIIGIILFLIGGICPAMMSSFTAITVLRGVFGVGVGILQVVCTALVAENFEGSERDRVQGNLQAAQMIGCAIMVFVSGWLASKGWNVGFYVHALGFISLVAALLLIPNVKPVKSGKAAGAAGAKAELTGAMWVWMVIAFFVFCTGQIFSNNNSFLVVAKGIGDSSASGLGMAFFCAGGITTGLLYGKIASACKKMTMSVGFLVMALGYLIMGLAPSIGVFYAGCLVFGIGMSITMPNVFLNVGNSVAPAAVGLALSIVTCVQNFGQFCSPYIVSPLTGLFGGMDASVASFYVAVGMGVILAAVTAVKAMAKKD